MKNKIFMKILSLMLLTFMMVGILFPLCAFCKSKEENETTTSTEDIIEGIEETTEEILETVIIYIPQEITTEETTTEVETISKDTEMNLRILEIDSSLDEMEWFKEYKKITEEYREYSDVRLPETVYDAYTEEEIEVMLSCIETEVYTGDFMSKCNVASVIFNRIHDKKFPNNPIDVITAPAQFAHGRSKITESTRLALEYVYIFGDTTNGCIAFRSDKKPNVWWGWEYQFTDDVGHNFYR